MGFEQPVSFQYSQIEQNYRGINRFLRPQKFTLEIYLKVKNSVSINNRVNFLLTAFRKKIFNEE